MGFLFGFLLGAASQRPSRETDSERVRREYRAWRAYVGEVLGPAPRVSPSPEVVKRRVGQAIAESAVIIAGIAVFVPLYNAVVWNAKVAEMDASMVGLLSGLPWLLTVLGIVRIVALWIGIHASVEEGV